MSVNGAEVNAMIDTLNTFLSNITLGEAGQHQGLTVIPLFSPDSGGPFYLTMSEALEQNLIVVTEISQGGSVPELQVENKGDIAVLLLDGEELAGAKQNRVLNTTILLREKSLTVIPVSCTEQGRWSYMSPEFFDSGNIMSPSVRHHKVRSVSQSLREAKGHKSDQSKVWREISDLSAKAEVLSATGAMNDVFQARKDNLKSLTEQFQVIDGQMGLLALDSHKVIGFDIVSRPEAFSRLYPKLLNSYAIDVILGEDQANHPSPNGAAKEFLTAIGTTTETTHEAVGYGTDHRFTGSNSVGSALVVGNAVIHMAFFGANGEEKVDPMSSSARRRRFRL